MTPEAGAPKFVEVAVPLPLDHPFTYRVPAGQESRARVGVRVMVPFGSRRITGLIVAVVDGKALGGRPAKEVAAFLDDEPYVTPRHLAFLAAAARECLAPPGEMLRAALPRGLPRHDAPPAARTETVFRAVRGAPVGGMTPKQAEVHAAVSRAGEIASHDLSARIPGGAEVARRMAAKGWLEAEARERPAGLSAPHLPEAARAIVLTAPQEAALARIGEALAKGAHAAFVLHGVTGSGKTEVYLRAVERARVLGRQSIFLVPEIALTPQLLGRVRARFGEDVAVLHSGLSPAGRAAQWKKVRAGEVSLCIGARSAVFSPFPEAGLVIVDEEHDPAYKQEDGIR
jgi:primosomal protein N' (replication factor Y)